MKKHLHKIDHSILSFFQAIHIPYARLSIFIIFAWFGFLKTIGASPANPLVAQLQEQTIPFLKFEQFIVLFGWYEVLIGVLFLIPKASRLAIILLAIHMVTTIGPLLLVPQATWQAPFIPTLEGQYIIKNLVIIATAIAIATKIKPMGLPKK